MSADAAAWLRLRQWKPKLADYRAQVALIDERRREQPDRTVSELVEELIAGRDASPTTEAVALVKALANWPEPVATDNESHWSYCTLCTGGMYHREHGDALTHADDCLWRRAVDLNERLGETP